MHHTALLDEIKNRYGNEGVIVYLSLKCKVLF